MLEVIQHCPEFRLPHEPSEQQVNRSISRKRQENGTELAENKTKIYYWWENLSTASHKLLLTLMEEYNGSKLTDY